MLVNQDNPVVLIVLPNAFHLGWMGATRRVFHISQAFEALGFDVVLLAGATTRYAVQQELDLSFPGRVIRLRHSGAYPPWIDKNFALRRVWRAGWKIRGGGVYWSKLSWGWADRLDVESLTSSLTEMMIMPSLVWGVSAGYLEGGVAAERIANRLKVPWVLELHDPPRCAGLGREQQEVRSRFSRLLTAAPSVVVTAASYAAQLQRDFGLAAHKLHTIHLTYQGSPSRRALESGRAFNLAYAGSLDGGRSLRSLVVALAKAFEQHPDMRRSFCLQLAGAGPGYKEVNRLIAEMDLGDSISSRGLLAAVEVNDLLRRANGTVVVENQSVLQVPGKTFEALQAGKPVVCLMDPECETAGILRRSGLGFIHEPTDVNGLRDTLIHLWHAWQRNETVVSPDMEFIGEYSVDLLPNKIDKVLANIIAVKEKINANSTATNHEGVGGD